MEHPEHIERLTHQGHLIAFVGEFHRFRKPSAADRRALREMGKAETGALTKQ